MMLRRMSRRTMLKGATALGALVAASGELLGQQPLVPPSEAGFKEHRASSATRGHVGDCKVSQQAGWG
jgi:TAT (twin-arginine translocation) pathway signal sequence